MENRISRREFMQWMNLALAAGAGMSIRASAQSGVTAGEVVERIKTKLGASGIDWRPSHFDGFHIGGPDVQVRGIAVTFQPGLEVLQRAAAKEKNFVICHESSFWDGFDPPQVMVDDPVHQAKIKFAADHKMAVWRIHDHWHRMKPDPIFMGLARKLGWTSYYDLTTQPRRYAIPEMPLEPLGRYIQEKLETKNVVIVGDRNLPVRTVGDCVHILSTVLPALHSCDVALVGETPEHDSFEYVRDAMSLGVKKGLIMISHERLEEWGMEDFVDWLKPIAPEAPIEWVSTGDPFEVSPIRV